MRLVALVAVSACAGGDGIANTGFSASVASAGTGDGPTGEASSAGATATSAADVTSTGESGPASSDADTGPCEATLWYFDGDGDGRGDPSATVSACEPPPQYVAFGDDCDDTNAARAPSAEEICDGLDNDCDEVVDEVSGTNASCNGCTLFAIAPRSYAFCPTGATWDAARVQCAALGGDLLRLDDEAENTAVAGLPEPASDIGGGWFIGLSDAASRGAFTWVDGGALTFAAWLAGEPNDAGGDEDCAEMDQAGGGWNDVPCSMVRAFVCESGGA